MSDTEISDTETPSIKVHSRKGSFLLSLCIAFTVGLFVAMLFGAVEVVIHNDNVQTNRQRAFSRFVSCQLISGVEEANGTVLYNVAISQKLGTKKANAAKVGYEKLATKAVEQKLKITGKSLFNSDGSINCNAYVKLGDKVPPKLAKLSFTTTTTSTGTTSK